MKTLILTFVVFSSISTAFSSTVGVDQTSCDNVYSGTSSQQMSVNIPTDDTPVTPAKKLVKEE